MNRTYLLIGGNMGNRFENLRKAASLLGGAVGKLIVSSSIYETEAWGKTDQPAFLNQVLFLETGLNPEQLLQKILHIEHQMGRERNIKFGPRTIDIDILFFNDAIIEQPDLVIPHPQLPIRRFALEPLNEIAPFYIHPVLHKRVDLLLKECPDTLAVKKL